MRLPRGLPLCGQSSAILLAQGLPQLPEHGARSALIGVPAYSRCRKVRCSNAAALSQPPRGCWLSGQVPSESAALSAAESAGALFARVPPLEIAPLAATTQRIDAAALTLAYFVTLRTTSVRALAISGSPQARSVRPIVWPSNTRQRFGRSVHSRCDVLPRWLVHLGTHRDNRQTFHRL